MEEQGFQPNDKVLAYNKDGMLYLAEVLKNEGKSRYYIHYNGWPDKWNEWVEASRVLPYTPENEALRMELRRQKVKKQKGGEGEERGGESSSITMADVLDKELYLEEEASESLGESWGDEECCTYDKGYTNQPIYACKECSASAQRQFGFCYGCSMKCHVDHTVYELFDRRKFRCDCGTPRSNFMCLFESQGSSDSSSSDAPLGRSTDNAHNNYSHNFDGLYCWCNQPYDHDSDATMFQCVRCEDWFHDECIKARTQGNVMPDEEDFTDFFCAGCLVACDYLLSYPHLRVYGTRSKTMKEEGTATETETAGGAEKKRKRDPSDQMGPAQVKQEEEKTAQHAHNVKEEKKEAEETMPKEEKDECKLDSVREKAPIDNAFWCAQWRAQLCTCSRCKERYEKSGCSFLLEPIDGDEEEEEGEAEGETKDEGGKKKGVSLLSSSQEAFATSLGRMQQVELLQGYQTMMEGLRNHLRPFAESGREVRKEDIEAFFANLNQKRRRTGD